jgi:hypothetical protein
MKNKYLKLSLAIVLLLVIGSQLSSCALFKGKRCGDCPKFNRIPTEQPEVYC